MDRRRAGGLLFVLVGLGLGLYAAAGLFATALGRPEPGIDEPVDVSGYVGHLQVALAAFLAALGVAVGALGWFAARDRLAWAWRSLAGIGVVVGVVAGLGHVAYGVTAPAHLAPGIVAGIAYAVALLFARP